MALIYINSEQRSRFSNCQNTVSLFISGPNENCILCNSGFKYLLAAYDFKHIQISHLSDYKHHSIFMRNLNINWEVSLLVWAILKFTVFFKFSHSLSLLIITYGAALISVKWNLAFSFYFFSTKQNKSDL